MTANWGVHSGEVVFGGMELTAGNHALRFEVTGKNSRSAGYMAGVD